MTSFWSGVGKLWCTVMHHKSMWPVYGYYRCSTCLRTYPVEWARATGSPAAAGGRMAKLAEEAQRWA